MATFNSMLISRPYLKEVRKMKFDLEELYDATCSGQTSDVIIYGRIIKAEYST
jgi:hypothetical protein